MSRVGIAGKFFVQDGAPFRLRGVRLEDPASADALPRALDGVAAAGFTVISCALPTPELLEEAAERGLHILARAPALPADRRTELRTRRRRLCQVVQRIADDPALLAVELSDRGTADDLSRALHDVAPELLVGWRDDRWRDPAPPPAEVDFLAVEFHGEQPELRQALSVSHRRVGDRPLLLDVTRREQARDVRDLPQPHLRDLLDTGLERGAAGVLAGTWRVDRASEPSGASAGFAAVNARTVRDLDVAWPSVAVVVCAFNEESTLEQCLRGCDGIDYPDLDLLVVDDGSTDATPAIARSHPRVRLCTVPHGGLAAARNVGFREARGDLVAYLDADAEPAPEWVWYLALGALGDGLAGAGGPNVPPPAEPLPARAVALASGGPMPQLRAEDRAVHVPGCNMAFWRPVLIELSGFDPVLRSAEDVEFEWRVLDAGRQIGYHPAALVWHHRRCGVRAYLRQQRSYGKGQALLERRIPERYRRGWRLRQLVEMLLPGRGERNEPAPTVAYVSVRWQERRLLDLAHRWGVPGTALLVLLAPLARGTRARRPLIIGTGTLLATLFTADLVTAGSGVRLPRRGLTFRARVAVCELLRPLAFQQGRLLQSRRLRSESRSWPERPGRIAPTP